MRIETTETKITVFAENDMVLCDGSSMTSVNGKVTAPPNADISAWKEMTQEEAEAIIVVYGDEEVTDEEFGAMVKEVL